ncbi:glyoxalase [Bacillus paralicheniformis]|uniref:VOC family protein n=1 Tax=Bacillus TaxID=1386 RepID=UPI000BA7D459|nr:MULTISPECIES: VOC family protein [Bacillus]MBC8621986.1 VOC family protein [Robertmurraya crescens]MBR8665844.1 VOC family protein [Bacillus paralicheniformis]PAE04560.1 glyoxalase [Bacillus paralicheniformis]
MGIKKVGQIGLPVQDLERAAAFYQDILGLSLLFQTDRMAFFECGGLRLLLSLPEKDEFAHASSVIYFQVEDLPAVYNEIATKGVSFPIEPHVAAKIEQTETWMAFFKDTEGNTLALMSEMQV